MVPVVFGRHSEDAGRRAASLNVVAITVLLIVLAPGVVAFFLTRNPIPLIAAAVKWDGFVSSSPPPPRPGRGSARSSCGWAGSPGCAVLDSSGWSLLWTAFRPGSTNGRSPLALQPSRR